MAGRDALSVQTSQNQQNNSVKHPETAQELYSDKLSLYFEWSPHVSLKNDARATPGNIRLYENRKKDFSK